MGDRNLYNIPIDLKLKFKGKTSKVEKRKTLP